MQNLLLWIYDFFEAFPLLSVLFLFFIILLLTFGFSAFFNRDYYKVMEIASEKVKEKLCNLQSIDLDLYLHQIALPIEHYENAKRLVTELAEKLSIKLEQLVFKESFKNYVCVPISELDLNIKQLKIFNLVDYISVYDYQFILRMTPEEFLCFFVPLANESHNN